MEAELAEVLGGRTPGFQDLPRLRYLSMVLKESLRLYPPFWMLTRTPVVDDVLSGHRVAAGSILMFSAYVTQRRPDFWPNPEAFDPERFLPERSEGRPQFAYFPFGGGPRLCIGGRLAEMQSLLVLAAVLQRYDLHAVPGPAGGAGGDALPASQGGAVDDAARTGKLKRQAAVVGCARFS